MSLLLSVETTRIQLDLGTNFIYSSLYRQKAIRALWMHLRSEHHHLFCMISAIFSEQQLCNTIVLLPGLHRSVSEYEISLNFMYITRIKKAKEKPLTT